MTQTRKELEAKRETYHEAVEKGDEVQIAILSAEILEGSILQRLVTEHQDIQKENGRMKSWIQRNEPFLPPEEMEVLRQQVKV